MSRQIRNAAVLFSVLLNVAFVVAYGVNRFGPGPLSGAESPSEPPLEEELGLSAEQWRAFAASRQEFFDLLAVAGRETRERQLELMDLIAQAPSDREAIFQKQEEIRSLQLRIQTAVVDHLIRGSAVLGPEQRRLFFARIKARIEDSDRPVLPGSGRLERAPAKDFPAPARRNVESRRRPGGHSETIGASLDGLDPRRCHGFRCGLRLASSGEP